MRLRSCSVARGDEAFTPKPTINGEARLAGVGGAKVVGDDALVTALVGEGYAAQVQDGGVLHHAASARPRHLRRP